MVAGGDVVAREDVVARGDVVSQWTECQIASVVDLGSNPGIFEAGLVAKSCYTTAGGQEYLDVDGGSDLLSQKMVLEQN
jgi:hypothetical protein